MQDNASVQIFEILVQIFEVTVLFEVSQTARHKLFLNCGEHLVDTATPEVSHSLPKREQTMPSKIENWLLQSVICHI